MIAAKPSFLQDSTFALTLKLVVRGGIVPMPLRETFDATLADLHAIWAGPGMVLPAATPESLRLAEAFDADSASYRALKNLGRLADLSAADAVMILEQIDKLS